MHTNTSFEKNIVSNWLIPALTGVSLLFLLPVLPGQSLPIIIDSQFEDWTSEAVEWNDPANDGDDIELIRMAVSNDDQYLFIQLETASEINLTDDHKLTLYIDSDLDQSTGSFFNGIGADLEIKLGERDVYYKLPSGQGYMSLNDIRFYHQPSVTSTVFEMAFDLSAVSNAGYDLFTANGVRLVWKDETGPFGDDLPNNGTVFTYLFDDTPVPPMELISLDKESPNALRLLTWNTLHNGLDDIDREPYFDRILGVLQPDLITFNECWDINAFQVASFMNAASPLPNFQNWQAIKLDNGNITASRYPILENWLIFPGQRLTASLIDLPSDVSSKDLLLVNAHFRCCENNFDRQREADAFVEFIQDAKNPGGLIDLPAGTPFILSGDLNLVDNRQQLTTLLTGEVVNNNQFGPGGPMDWDGSDLIDVIGLHTQQPFAYTWKNDFSSYPPSRIDYHIISGSVLEVEKSYTLQTETMSQELLDLYGLQANDAIYASDHFPKVTDLLLPEPVATSEQAMDIHLTAQPNPVRNTSLITFDLTEYSTVSIQLRTATGQLLQSQSSDYPTGKNTLQIDLSDYPPGIYFAQLNSREGVGYIRLLKD